MTQKDKDLLIKDLCARLPYKVKAYIKNWSKLDQKYYEGIYTIESVHPSLNDIYASTENGSVGVILGHTDYVIKPYLRPKSSMTGVEVLEYLSLKESIVASDGITYFFETPESIDWLNKNMFDYRGLIPIGLANDATRLNIY